MNNSNYIPVNAKVLVDKNGNEFFVIPLTTRQKILLHKKDMNENLNDVEIDNITNQEEVLLNLEKEFSKEFSIDGIDTLFERFEQSIPKIMIVNILQGLSEKQKNYVKAMVSTGCNPYGFKIYTDSGDIYYFGIYMGRIKEDLVENVQ
jgi:hypothetical protein